MTETGPTDERLVRSALTGDREAYFELVRRYKDPLFRHAVRMLDREGAAADAVEEALLRGYRTLGDCPVPDRVEIWFFRITAELCRSRSRSRREIRWTRQVPPPGRSPSSGTADGLWRMGLRDEVEDLLAHLSPARREAFVLRDLEGLSYREVAVRLGIPLRLARERVRRARGELQHVSLPGGGEDRWDDLLEQLRTLDPGAGARTAPWFESRILDALGTGEAPGVTS